MHELIVLSPRVVNSRNVQNGSIIEQNIAKAREDGCRRNRKAVRLLRHGIVAQEIRCVRFSTERLPFSKVQPSPYSPQYVLPVYGLMAAAFIDLNARDSPLKSKWKSLAAQSSSEAVGILVGCASATGALASESNSIDQLDRLEASAFTPRSGNQ